MYIKKIMQILLILLFSSTCNKPEEGLYGKKYLDGNVRSFDFLNDTLFVASESEGIFIY